jgi:hypothetical protein
MGRKVSGSVTLEMRHWNWLDKQPEDTNSETVRRIIENQMEIEA